MLRRDSIVGTLTVALALCVVCSVIVSGAAVGLRSRQEANRKLERQRNILAAAGLLEEEGVDVKSLYAERVTPRMFDFTEEKFVDASAEEIEEFDAEEIAEAKDTSIDLPEGDPAGIGRRENRTVVYLVNDSAGELDKLVLPVRGKGLWSTLYGFLAVEADGETIAGLTFYEHGETPGLGGEVDNERWKQQWPGKSIYGDDGEIAVEVVKGVAQDEAHQVDGLSGATITTRGVNNLVHFWLGEQGFGPLLQEVQAGEIETPAPSTVPPSTTAAASRTQTNA